MDEVLSVTDQLSFLLNGNKITVDTTKVTPKTTLNAYIRKTLHLTGTKYMCYEGGCGACIVSATLVNPATNVKETKAVNSCLVSVLMTNGWEITTIEGLGDRAKGYHQIQQAIVDYNATQCGFCTPGMIMNMYALRQAGQTTAEEIERSFGSNICRCTGYRPILTAFKSIASSGEDSLPDIEDLDVCSKSCLFRNDLPMNLLTLNASNNWYKVSRISDIFAIFRRNSRRSYQLVAGNTAKGVYKSITDREYFIDISSVKELKEIKHSTRVLCVGGGVTLNEAIALFKKVSKEDDGFKHLAKVAGHLELVAHVPVRNIGTIAGNLSIKHTFKNFSSDVFLLLETIGAMIVISAGGYPVQLSPKDYLSYDMNLKIIRSVDIPPLDSSYKFESYKIMKRAQNSHAIINAGFLFKFKDHGLTAVERCSIVYGGVNSHFIHATETERLVNGKVLFDNNNMQKFFAKLESEIVPEDAPADPSPQFRRKLCVSLFYKFILSICPDGLKSASNKSGGEKLIRPPVSRGVQDFKTNESMYPVGEPILKLEARDQASGEAKYVTDEADVHNQRFAAFVQGKAAPGSVLQSIDPAEALKLFGVEAFFQASDIPGINSFTIGDSTKEIDDEEIFVELGKKLKYYYQPVGVIVATSQSIAMEGANLVKVTFKHSPTSPLLTVADVLTHKERIHHLRTWEPKHQDADAPVKFDGIFDSLHQYHYHMELQVASVHVEDDGSLSVKVGAQWMDAVQCSISRSMNIPAHKISVRVKRVGGSFGAKITRASLLGCAAALAAIKLRKPVKLFLTLEATMNIIGKRHAMSSYYDVGVDHDGKVGYLNGKLYSNTGIHRNTDQELFVVDLYNGPYNTDAFNTELNFVKTDLAACTWMRCPGYMEGSAFIENIMEHIAYKLDKDPIEVRLLNFKDDSLLVRLTQEAITWSDYRRRKSAIDKFNLENTWRKKGISLIPVLYTLRKLPAYYAQVSVFYVDGTVALCHGGVEIGQGINTKLAQVAAYILGIDISMIQIIPSDVFVAPNNTATAGSMTTESLCVAVKNACTTLLERINGASAPDQPWIVKVQKAFEAGLSLSENSFHSPSTSLETFYHIYGVGVSEIELDVLTGQIIVQRVDLLQDTGNSLNPYIDIGQVEGAFVMGMGHWTSEEIIYDHDGAIVTNNTWKYKVPGAQDIPVDFRVKFPEGIPNPLTPFKNKAVSEPPLCLAFSVPLAIKHALKSARTQFDPKLDPWSTMHGPCTLEWIYTNSQQDPKHYKL